MRENIYRNMMNTIHVPEELNEQVLATSRQRRYQRNKQQLGRLAICAVLALVLVLGSVSLQPAERVEDTADSSDAEKVLPLDYRFGLTAYAADAAKFLSGVNSGIVFHWLDNRGTFRVVGEGIESVSLSVDRGTLWREGVSLGDTVTEDLEPSAVYGVMPAEGMTMDSLDGAKLILTAAFTDGTEKTDCYRLSTENLRVFENENGDTVMVPALQGDPDGLSSFLYAVSETNSVWFCWPVQGSNTVSLSNRYGYRVGPGGQNGAFHAGIDIPAELGAPVLAAADGTVTEASFDANRGNYLVLDHGNGMETVYAHCLHLDVEAGDAVAAGQEVATVGSTGLSTGPHLHFEVRQDGEAQNPVAFFDSEIRDTLKMG